jgi:hypothetical protein
MGHKRVVEDMPRRHHEPDSQIDESGVDIIGRKPGIDNDSPGKEMKTETKESELNHTSRGRRHLHRRVSK